MKLSIEWSVWLVLPYLIHFIVEQYCYYLSYGNERSINYDYIFDSVSKILRYLNIPFIIEKFQSKDSVIELIDCGIGTTSAIYKLHMKLI